MFYFSFLFLILKNNPMNAQLCNLTPFSSQTCVLIEPLSWTLSVTLQVSLIRNTFRDSVTRCSVGVWGGQSLLSSQTTLSSWVSLSAAVRVTLSCIIFAYFKSSKSPGAPPPPSHCLGRGGEGDFPAFHLKSLWHLVRWRDFLDEEGKKKLKRMNVTSE